MDSSSYMLPDGHFNIFSYCYIFNKNNQILNYSRYSVCTAELGEDEGETT